MFFCFKQKTAYEMRISDWSSDVCSSDLEVLLRPPRLRAVRADHPPARVLPHPDRAAAARRQRGRNIHCRRPARARGRVRQRQRAQDRSEEHTSELQSLMRISYAVFCLKKNNKKKKTVLIEKYYIQ